jgi:hypothetical protein
MEFARRINFREDWREYLTEALEADEAGLWRHHERTGWPLGQPAFLDRIEAALGRIVRPGQTGVTPTHFTFVLGRAVAPMPEGSNRGDFQANRQ